MFLFFSLPFVGQGEDIGINLNREKERKLIYKKMQELVKEYKQYTGKESLKYGKLIERELGLMEEETFEREDILNGDSEVYAEIQERLKGDDKLWGNKDSKKLGSHEKLTKFLYMLIRYALLNIKAEGEKKKEIQKNLQEHLKYYIEIWRELNKARLAIHEESIQFFDNLLIQLGLLRIRLDKLTFLEFKDELNSRFRGREEDKDFQKQIDHFLQEMDNTILQEMGNALQEGKKLLTKLKRKKFELEYVRGLHQEVREVDLLIKQVQFTSSQRSLINSFKGNYSFLGDIWTNFKRKVWPNEVVIIDALKRNQETLETVREVNLEKFYFLSIALGKTENVKNLLANGIASNISMGLAHPLEVAIKFDRVDLIRILLESGERLNSLLNVGNIYMIYFLKSKRKFFENQSTKAGEEKAREFQELIDDIHEGKFKNIKKNRESFLSSCMSIFSKKKD